MCRPICSNQKKAWTQNRLASTSTKATHHRNARVNCVAWGLTAREARTHESLARRLAREVPDVTDQWDGDGIGDSADSDGELIDDQVGDMRAGRLVAFDVDPTDPGTDYLAHDVGIDGGAASAEEAAMHIVVDEDTSAGEGWRL